MLPVLASSAGLASNLATVGAALVAAVGTVLGAIVVARSGREARKIVAKVEGDAAQVTLEGRLDELKDLMQRTARLVVQVTAELGARAATARQLQKEAEDAEALAALHKDQADAVRRMIDAELATATRRIRSDSIKIGIASFIAGGGLTLLVTLLVHPIH